MAKMMMMMMLKIKYDLPCSLSQTDLFMVIRNFSNNVTLPINKAAKPFAFLEYSLLVTLHQKRVEVFLLCVDLIHDLPEGENTRGRNS